MSIIKSELNQANTLETAFNKFQEYNIKQKLLDNEIQKITTDLVSSGSFKNIDQIQMASRLNEENSKHLKDEIERANSSYRQSEDQLRNIESRMNQLGKRKDLAIAKAKEKSELIASKDESIRELKELNDNVFDLNRKHAQDTIDHDKVSKNLNIVSKDNEIQNNSLLSKLQEIEFSINQMKNSINELER